jgi:outer membrane immunogenic protein
MKKLLLALAAAAAFTGSASAADMAMKAARPMPQPIAPVMSWTGCWISGGGGGGINKVSHDNFDPTDSFLRQQNADTGMSGWLATVGAGCDYQFSGRWVIGAFADATWSDISGDHGARIGGVGDMSIGRVKNDWSWAVGGRVGYLVAPNVLTYVNAGFTQTHLTQTNMFNLPGNSEGTFTGIAVPAQTFNGVFVGSGIEYAFDWLPGLFVKSEGRAAWFDRKDTRAVCVASGSRCDGPGDPSWISDDNLISRRLITYMGKVELVYRFNWGKQPVVARY